MSPFYRRLPNVESLGVEVQADQLGLGIVGGVAAAFAAHGVLSAIRARQQPIARHGEETVNAQADEGKRG
jgi:hydrogenase small subunit